MSNNSMWFNCSRSHSLEKQRHRFYNHLNFHLLNGLDSVQTWRVDVSWAIFCHALRFRSTASLRARSGKLQVLIQSWSKNLSKFIQILCLLEHHRRLVMFAAISDPFPSFSKFSPIPFVIDRLLGTDNIKCLSLGHGHLKAGSILTHSSFGAAMLHQVRRLSWSHELNVMGIRWHLQHNSTSDARWKVWWFRTEKLVNSRRSIDQNSKEPA